MSINDNNNNDALKSFSEQVAKEQAEKMGVRPDEIMLKVVDGKKVWVKRSEVFAQLEQQRRLVTPKKIPRALRGEDSLIHQIGERVKTCLDLNRSLNKRRILNTLESSDFQAFSLKTQEKSHNLAVQLGEVESSIENLKEKDPVFTEAENLFHEIKNAKERGETELVATLHANNGELIRKYETRRQKLGPYLESARQFRLEIQKEFWRVLMIHWKILESGVKFHLKRLTEDSSEMSSVEQKDLFTVGEHDSREVAEALNNAVTELARSLPLKNAGPQNSSEQYDALIPELKRYIDMQNSLFQNLERIESKSTTESQEHHRMAYAEQKH